MKPYELHQVAEGMVLNYGRVSPEFCCVLKLFDKTVQSAFALRQQMCSAGAHGFKLITGGSYRA